MRSLIAWIAFVAASTGAAGYTIKGGRCATTDSAFDTCSASYDINPEDCGGFDDEDFTASEQCCACGGGLNRPTLTPTISLLPLEWLPRLS